MVEQKLNSRTHDAIRSYIIIATANATRAAALRSAAAELTEDIIVAPDGAAATQLMSRRGAPRLLITDLSLPTLDGFALVRQLRQLSAPPRSAVIVLSAHESLRTAARDLAEPLGIANVLRPDTDRAALRAAIATAYNDVVEDRVPPARAKENGRPATDSSTFDEVLRDAAFAVARRFNLPGVGAYAMVNDEPRFVAFISMENPADPFNGSSAWSTLPQVASSGESLIVPDVQGHPVFGDAAAGSTIRSFASVPIASPEGTSWGALCVIDTKPLTLDAAALDALALHGQEVGRDLDQRFGLPQHAAATFQILEQLAATDPLTGLANRRGCEKGIASEISRAKREQKPLSCILIDVDRFKQVNDTYGHPAGDQVLREISSIIRRSVRAYDIVCRWGGEEFLLVLAGADLPSARALAERIRVAVETLPSPSAGRVTISAGIATFDDDYNFDATIRLADRRLYQAKGAGRNCVI
jgi:diguanylate cyclase (GGDEF)-like protein